jgi:phospholipase C
VMSVYHGFAKSYAIADRYFQPVVGQSSANDMYFAVAREEFKDNAYKPKGATGDGCILPIGGPTISYTHKTIADVLLESGESFGVYAGGYKAMKESFFCPTPPGDCTFPTPQFTPCNFDPSDIPFEYYDKFVDNDTYLHDFTQLKADIDANQLPSFAYVKETGYRNEHPGFKTKISKSTAWVDELVNHVLSTKYGDDTLILITWDEGGGYYDHISPPGVSPVDNAPYGTRVPLIAIGRFARKNHVSHAVMEHSSVVRFLEYNFTGEVGQLAARDAVVNNIGSMLDPDQAGLIIPE